MLHARSGTLSVRESYCAPRQQTRAAVALEREDGVTERLLGLDPEAAMKLLQQLFEDGHITYHRTDSTALAPEAVAAARTALSRD